MSHKKEPAAPLRSRLEVTMGKMGPLTPLPTAARRLSRVCLQEVMVHLDGTIEGKDPEHLHQMRVASRRLRAALRVFAPCYPNTLDGAVERSRNITRLLGSVRDLDVRMNHLENLRPLVDKKADRAIDLLIFHTNLQREEARVNMVKGLTEVREGNWNRWMSRALSNAELPEGLFWYPASRALTSISANRSNVVTHSFLAQVESALTGQHAFRIAIKKYKYSIELLKFCFKKDIEDVLQLCKSVQDDLGLMHDYDVIQEYLKRTRSRTMPRPIKKGMTDLSINIDRLRHEQFVIFCEHLGPFLEADPLEFAK
jgi:CHAD domain-containing protein